MPDVQHCIPFSELSLDDVGQVGGKAASLGELTRALAGHGLKVPPGFAVTAAAYDACLGQGRVRSELDALLRDVTTSSIDDLARRGERARRTVLEAGLPEPVKASIVAAYRQLEARLGPDPAVAVRSSATAEDSPEASFAGQQATLLNVRGEREVLHACLVCFSSLFTDRAIAYRHEKGFAPLGVRGAIAVQQMVRADLGSAGVIFTLDPDSGFRSVVVVTGSWGLGETVVAGRVDPDEFVLFKPAIDHPRPILSRRLGAKQSKMLYARGKGATTRTVPVSAGDQARFCLQDAEAIQLAKWAMAIEEHYSRRYQRPTPMDIEWAKDGQTGELYIVQARPETIHANRQNQAMVRWVLEDPPPALLRGVAIGRGIGVGPASIIADPARLEGFQQGEVLVADMTDPDWVPLMRKASAIVTNRGGRTCHAAIVSRELGIPCIVGTGHATQTIAANAVITVSCGDANDGRVYRGEVAHRREEVSVSELAKTRTQVMLTLGNPARAFELAQLPVAGVGLARQEFVVAQNVGVHPLAALSPQSLSKETRARVEAMASRHSSPREYFVDGLASGVAQIAAAFHPRPVIVRLGDFKSNEYASLLGGEAFEPREENPMLGLRGASRYLDPTFEPAFDLECEALLRVRKDMGLRNVKLMVPFCRTPKEGQQVIARLAAHGLVQGRDGLEVWVMCELPANVVLVEQFAQVFDGFSIGSNDLTQLVLGIDRDSERLAYLFRESDEAVLRTIEAAIKGAHAGGRPIGLCGQAPSDDPEFARFLVRLGIDSVSFNPDAVQRGAQVIRQAESDERGAGGD
ncbi:MAG: phosphoenolpyruvate synthase [Myxococcales bacterium FL481]|nr:MAG: phosphoenolpyruvate synthase [Myxococcales bacterium FL481]